MSKRPKSPTLSYAEQDTEIANMLQLEVKDITSHKIQRGPFFNKLNLDVRRTIYECLYDGLPHRSYESAKSDCNGLALSCKQAYTELKEGARCHLTVFAEEFCKKFKEHYNATTTISMPIHIHGDFLALRNITFSLHFSTFNLCGNVRKSIRVELIDHLSWINFWLPQLLVHSFDKVTLVAQDGERPPHATEKERKAIACVFREQLDEIAVYFAIGNTMKQARQQNRLPALRRTLPYSQSLVKHIGFAWNLISSSSDSPATFQDSITMMGEKLTCSSRHPILRPGDEDIGELEYENLCVHRYEVISADGLVGEMGIVSPRRWVEGEYADLRSSNNLAKESVQMIGIGGKLSKVGEEKN